LPAWSAAVGALQPPARLGHGDPSAGCRVLADATMVHHANCRAGLGGQSLQLSPSLQGMPAAVYVGHGAAGAPVGAMGGETSCHPVGRVPPLVSPECGHGSGPPNPVGYPPLPGPKKKNCGPFLGMTCQWRNFCAWIRGGGVTLALFWAAAGTQGVTDQGGEHLEVCGHMSTSTFRGNSQDGRKTRGSKSIGYLVVGCAALPLANASRGKSTPNATLNTTWVPEPPMPPSTFPLATSQTYLRFFAPPSVPKNMSPNPSCLWSSLSMASCWRPSFKLHGRMRGTPLPLEGWTARNTEPPGQRGSTFSCSPNACSDSLAVGSDHSRPTTSRKVSWFGGGWASGGACGLKRCKLPIPNNLGNQASNPTSRSTKGTLLRLNGWPRSGGHPKQFIDCNPRAGPKHPAGQTKIAG